jgi:hypothetical protein
VKHVLKSIVSNVVSCWFLENVKYSRYKKNVIQRVSSRICKLLFELHFMLFNHYALTFAVQTEEGAVAAD